MRSRGTKPTCPSPRQKNPAGDRVPDACRDQWGNGLDRVTDREVRRAPDEIDRGEGEGELDGVGAAMAGCGLAWIGHEHRSTSNVNHFAAADQGHNLRRLMVYHDLTSKVLFTG